MSFINLYVREVSQQRGKTKMKDKYRTTRDRSGSRNDEFYKKIAKVGVMVDRVLKELNEILARTEDDNLSIISDNYQSFNLTSNENLAKEYDFRFRDDEGHPAMQVHNLLKLRLDNDQWECRQFWLRKVDAQKLRLMNEKKVAQQAIEQKRLLRLEKQAKLPSEYIPSPELLAFVRNEITSYKAGLISKVSSYETLANQFGMAVCGIEKALKAGLEESEKTTLFSLSKRHANPRIRQRELLVAVRKDLGVGRILTIAELEKEHGLGYENVAAAMSELTLKESQLREKLSLILRAERVSLQKDCRPTTLKEYAKKHGLEESVVSQMLQTMLTEDQMTLRQKRLVNSKPKSVSKLTGYMRFSEQVRSGILAQVNAELISGKATSNRMLTKEWGMEKNDLYDFFVANLTPKQRELRRTLVAGRPAMTITDENVKLLIEEVRAEIIADKYATGSVKLVAKYGGNERVVLKLIKSELTADEFEKRLLLLRKRETSDPPQLVARHCEQKAAAAINELLKIKDNVSPHYRKTIAGRLRQMVDLLE